MRRRVDAAADSASDEAGSPSQQHVYHDQLSDEALARAARKREKRRIRSEKADWYANKLHALLWVVTSVVLMVFTDFVSVLITSPVVLRTWVAVGSVLFLFVTLAVLYMACLLPSIKVDFDTDSITQMHPKLVPIVSFASVLCFFCLCIGLWPMYQLFTPVLLLWIWFGMIMSLHFVPIF